MVQTSLLVSVLLIAMSIGLIPDRHGAVMQGRAKLCESIAIATSLLADQRDTSRLEAILQGVVRRNDDILSAALRRDSGKLLAEAGEHTAQWQGSEEEAAEGSYVHVPIWADEKEWGSVEVRFRPLKQDGILGFLHDPGLHLVVAVAFTCFLLYLFYLRKMLRHLDPSKVVPKRVRSALDTLAEGLLVMDKDERIVLANRSFAATVGQSPDQLQGRRASTLPWLAGASEAAASPGTYPWLHAIKAQTRQTGVMLGLNGSGKAPRVFMVNSSPVLGDGGKIRGALASFEDVTPLEESKVELRKSKDAAEAANRAKSDFLARMSHEIRTPMNAILGFTDVLRRGLVKEETERQEHLTTIHTSGKHLLDLINDILDLSKIESGRMEVEQRRCSPSQLVFDVLNVLQVRAQEKGITLGYKFGGKMPETILTDPMRLRQTVMNLVGNAIKFTDTGGVEVVARLLESDEEPQLAIDVSDSGIGIPPEAIDRIFEPFGQADTSVTRKFGGTGLGLTISRQFTEALGGSLIVQSEAGKGSVFTVTVNTGPLEGVRMVGAEEAASTSAQDSGQDQALPELPPARVLLVEDGESNRTLITLVLEEVGVEVEEAENGQIAVDMATAGKFDLILMDMEMPVMDGYTATAKLRELGMKIPIIALTAHAMQGDEDKCRSAGCSGFLTKPIDMDLLIKTMAQELEGVSKTEGVL